MKEKQQKINIYFFFVSPLLPIHFRCRGLLLHLITLSDKLDRTPWTRVRPVAEASTCKIHNIHKRQTSMPPARFELAIPASERSHTYASDWPLASAILNTLRKKGMGRKDAGSTKRLSRRRKEEVQGSVTERKVMESGLLEYSADQKLSIWARSFYKILFVPHSEHILRP